MALSYTDLPHKSRGVAFPARALPLHAMLTSCGFMKESTPAYDWHGLKRGAAEFVLIQYTVSGKGRLSYEGAVRDVLPGQALVLRFPHDNRYWLPASYGAWEFFWVCLSGAEVVRVWRSVEKRVGPVVALDAGSRTVGCMVDIYRKALGGQIRSPFESSALAYGLAMALLGDVLPVESGDRPAAVRRVLEYCRAHFGEPIGVDEMAAVSGYSRFHFCRRFRESEKTSPGAYLAGLRLRQAAGLLQVGGLSVKEVAIRCGYGDPNYFCKAFRKAFGTSPGALRKSGM